MTIFNCNCKRDCALLAVVTSLIIGVITAFLQINAVIAVTPVFLIVAFGIAIVYLGLLLVATALTRRAQGRYCECRTLRAVLAGILATILLSVILLAVGITATSIVSAILIGLLAAFLTLTFTATACLILCLTDCEN